MKYNCVICVILFTFVFLMGCNADLEDEIPCACSIDVHTRYSIERYLPAFLNYTTKEILYPTPKSLYIPVGTGEKIEVHCNGEGGIAIEADTLERKNHSHMLEATCLHGWNFQIAGEKIDLRSLSCQKKVKTSILTHKKQCGDEAKEYYIGFTFDSNFYTVLTVCFDKHENRTLYIKTKLNKNLGSWPEGLYKMLESIVYKQGLLRSDKLYRLYRPVNLRYRINSQLGLEISNLTYINDRHTLYRSQLIPDYSFLYPFEKQLTYYYVNTVPQWTNLNEDTWTHIDKEFYKLALSEQIVLTFIVGTFGSLGMRHQNESTIDMRISVDPDIPIPEVIWKAIIDEKNKAGIAFIAVNNVFRVPLHIGLCENIGPFRPWFHYNVGEFNTSKIYACEISKLGEVIPYLRNYEVDKILDLKSQ